MFMSETLLFSKDLQAKKRADERTRTADLFSLRVIIHALQGFAHSCESRISKPITLPPLARRCTVLRSRWCQSGVNFTLTPSCEWFGSTSVMVGATVSSLIVSVRMLPLPVFSP